MSHSPEPWAWQDDDQDHLNDVIKDRDGKVILETWAQYGYESGVTIEKADSARIILCVNALSGIPESDFDELIRHINDRFCASRFDIEKKT